MPAISSFSAKSSNYDTPGSIVHSRMLPAHTQLKYRKKKGVDRDDLKRKLEDKEQVGENGSERSKSLKSLEGNKSGKGMEEDSEFEGGKVRGDESGNESKSDDDHNEYTEDEDEEEAEDAEDDEGDEDDEDDEDEEVLLRRELEKIKRERAEKKLREEQEASSQAQDEYEREVAYGNPLLNPKSSSGFQVKKSWTQESVFRNQAKKQTNEDPKFVNDMLRTDFHRKFVNKYIR